MRPTTVCVALLVLAQGTARADDPVPTPTPADAPAPSDAPAPPEPPTPGNTPAATAPGAVFTPPEAKHGHRYVERTRYTPTDELAYDLKVDLPVTIISGAVLGTAEGLKNTFGPTTCRWCETPTSLNRFDASARSTLSSANRDAAAIASDVIAYGAIPVFALGLDLLSNYQNRDRPGKHWGKRFGIDTLLLLESTVTALALHQGAKFASARRRPLAIDEPTDAERAVDKNFSFFSGHTTLAFVVASTMATELTFRRHRLAPLAWALGMAGATSVAMLRVASDSHYATDVIVGAVVGSAVGVLVPFAHRGRAPVRFGGSATQTSGLVTVSGVLF